MELIGVSKKFGDTGRYNTHHINVNYIIEMYEWSGSTVILLSTGDKIECLDTLENILNKINKL